MVFAGGVRDRPNTTRTIQCDRRNRELGVAGDDNGVGVEGVTGQQGGPGGHDATCEADAPSEAIAQGPSLTRCRDTRRPRTALVELGAAIALTLD